GLVNHRLLPIRDGRPVSITKAAVVVIAFALHLTDRANPVPIGVKVDPGDELLDGGWFGAYPPIGWQANFARVGAGHTNHRWSGLAGLCLLQAEMDPGGVGRLGFAPVGAGGAARG